MVHTSVSRSEGPAGNRTRSGKLRRFGIAGGSAVAACAGACAVPVLAVAGVGGGVVGGLARLLRPGMEPVIGAGVFLAVLAGFAIVRRRRRAAGGTCGATSCDAGGSRR